MKQNSLEPSSGRDDFSLLAMLRFSEIAIKSSKTRKWLTNLLIKHIKFLLEKHLMENFEVINEYSRIFIKTTETDKALETLTTTLPGIVSGSKVYITTSNQKDIEQLISERFLSKIKNNSSFAIKVKRTGKHDFSSIELAAQIGEYVLEELKEKNVIVDLSAPDYTIFIEVREGKAYVFDEIIRGLGGLPVGCQGNVLVLVEGKENELANVMEVYKRGALTYIVKIQKNLNPDFMSVIDNLLEVQMFLKSREIPFIGISENEKILEFYEQRKCSAIVLSENLFNIFQDKIPVTIPIFIPDLVTEIGLTEIQKFQNLMI